MATTLARIIKYGFQSLVRNPWLTIATVLVMIFAIVVFEGLIIFNVLTDKTIAALEDKIDIAVYFKSTAPEDTILSMERSLEALAEVASVEYVSRDKALEIFKARNADDAIIVNALDELKDNPLLASLNIKAHDPKDYALIATYVGDERFAGDVEKVTYTQSRAAIERLTGIVDTAKRTGFFLTLFLAVTAVLVAFNTVRLAIYSNKEEISIMRLVGGSNVFINGPYVVQGILFGILSALVGFLILIPVIHFASPRIQSFIPEVNMQTYFYSSFLSLLGYQLLFGIILGVVSSTIAVRRYLKT